MTLLKFCEVVIKAFYVGACAYVAATTTPWALLAIVCTPCIEIKEGL